MSIIKNKKPTNNFFMELALMQAKKNLGNTNKNPSVGCVIVKNNHLISAACTSLKGRPHAEVNAISFANNKVKDSSMYVTLEPCSHYGITAPCVKSIVSKKIKKVFFSVNDPDPRSYNKSSKYLKRSNIKVKKGLLYSRSKSFYKSYFKSRLSDVPFLTAKLAVSKNLYTSRVKKKWITNKYSRGRVHLMRNYNDCILTSVKTVISDDPLLNCRISGTEKNSPARVILDKELKIPMNSRIVKTSIKYTTIIFFNKANKNKIKRLKDLKIKLVKFPLNNDGEFNLRDVMIKIKILGYSRLFLESGLKLLTNFLKMNLINDFYLFTSNKSIGKREGRNSFKKVMNIYFNKKLLTLKKVNLLGDKLFFIRLNNV